jgi:hypothetical protein
MVITAPVTDVRYPPRGGRHCQGSRKAPFGFLGQLMVADRPSKPRLPNPLRHAQQPFQQLGRILNRRARPVVQHDDSVGRPDSVFLLELIFRSFWLDNDPVA